MTSKDIQTAIIKSYQAKDMCLANFYFDTFECDVFRLQSNGFFIEYEIKISRSDFLNDFKKKRYGVDKHQNIKEGKRCNRFYFVVPEGLIKATEVPPHCGLIYYNGVYLTVVKNAKLLTKEKIKPAYFKTLAYKLYYKLRDSKLNYKDGN